MIENGALTFGRGTAEIGEMAAGAAGSEGFVRRAT
jgi:hypothetical protein